MLIFVRTDEVILILFDKTCFVGSNIIHDNDNSHSSMLYYK